MSCEINDNPCDECEEPYCPDMLADAHNKFHELRWKIEHIEQQLLEAKTALDEHRHKHPTLTDNWKTHYENNIPN